MKDFFNLMDDISRSINSMPNRIANHSVNFFKSRFVKQNWHDSSPEPWKPRSRSRRGGKARQRGAILVDSGRLKRSIRAISVSSSRLVIGTDAPYAEVHNEGIDSTLQVRQHSRRSRKGRVHKVKSHSRKFKMPQRRFLGESQELTRQLSNLIISEINNAIK